MKLPIPPEPLFIIKTLKEAGFDGYMVGGAVRDLMLKKQVKDFDFATNATPDEIKKLFPENFYENEFGTVSITHEELLIQMGLDVGKRLSSLTKSTPTPKPKSIIDYTQASKIHESLAAPAIKKDEPAKEAFWPDFEITTYRSQELYENFRHPDPTKLEWGKTIEEDLRRRDFTLNAMALAIKDEKNCKLIDPHQGLDDLKQSLIKTVGDPQVRFQEDALRMLRAIRFSVQLNMKIDDSALRAITQQKNLIKHISWERIRDEFIKILKSDYPAEGIELLDETGLLEHIMPELLTTKGVEQGKHHVTDVWHHSLNALRECPSTDPIVRLSTLLHDIAKPQTFKRIKGEITSYNHEIVGSRIAKKIAKRLRLSKDDCARVFTLVRHHMFHYQPHHTDAAIRRFMRKVELENLDDILDLREGDRLGSGAKKTSWRLEEMKQRMIEQLHQPMAVTDLAIDGNDLIKELGLKPGPAIGEILDKLLEKVMEEPELNQKKTLFSLLKDFLPQQQ